MKYEPKTIYCPLCGRKVGTYDGRATVNPVYGCKKCRKRVVYHIDSEESELKLSPGRACSSGMTFY